MWIAGTPARKGAGRRASFNPLPASACRALLLFAALAWLSAGPCAEAQAQVQLQLQVQQKTRALAIEAQQGALEDDRVRKALALGIDWRRLAKGGGLDLDDVFLRDGDREKALEPARADPDGARKLLAQAGYGPNAERPLNIVVFYQKPLEKMLDGILGALKELGIGAQPQLVTPETLDKAIAATRVATGRQTYEVPYLLLTLERRAAPPPQQQPLADLLPLGQPLADYDAGRRTLTLSIDVGNRGAARSGPFQIQFFDRGGTVKVSPLDVEDLGPRQKLAYKLTLPISEEVLGRELALLAVIDSADQVRESDETNNRSDLLRYTLPRPQPQPEPQPQPFVDLVVAGQPKAAFDAGRQVLRVSVAAANLGDAPAGPHLLAVVDRNRQVAFPPLRIAGLKAGTKAVYEVEAKVPAAALGSRLALVAVIDAEREIAERDEANNVGEALAYSLPPPLPQPRPQSTQQPEPQPQPQPQPEPQPQPQPRRAPDLAITGLSIIRQGDGAVSVSLAVSNRGEAASPASEVELTAEAAAAWQRLPVPPLEPGKIWRADWALPPAGGLLGRALGQRLDVVAFVDPDNRVAESEEGNNRRPQRADLPIPLATWIAGAVLAAVAFGGLLLVLLRKPGRRARPSAAPHLRYVARGDAGTQRIERSGGAPAITVKLALRPIVDAGSQAVAAERG